MDPIFQAAGDSSTKKTFIGHVFSSNEEDKAEFMNIIQYGIYALIPVVVLNKLIQRFIPEADPEKSSLELLLEIFIQVIVIFCGIIVIHRVITFFPTYSGFKYENLALTNVILAFLVVVMSIQSKLGIKANILVDRISELWNGREPEDRKRSVKNGVRVSKPMSGHSPSQADYLDGPVQNDIFPPAAMSSQRPSSTDSYDYMMKGGSGSQDYAQPMGPVAANALVGSSFGAF
jgi:hypothetical protein